MGRTTKEFIHSAYGAMISMDFRKHIVFTQSWKTLCRLMALAGVKVAQKQMTPELLQECLKTKTTDNIFDDKVWGIIAREIDDQYKIFKRIRNEVKVEEGFIGVPLKKTVIQVPSEIKIRGVKIPVQTKTNTDHSRVSHSYTFHYVIDRCRSIYSSISIDIDTTKFCVNEGVRCYVYTSKTGLTQIGIPNYFNSDMGYTLNKATEVLEKIISRHLTDNIKVEL